MKKRTRQHTVGSGGVRVVAIGGGTGLSMQLRGLKHYVARRGQESERHPISDLAAIVTVTDDGGSSGRLRREYRVLPPGDIRNCMVALSQDEALLGRLFQYRFHAGRGLRGHSFGNLFLTALSHVTGDFAEAVRVSGEVLAIRGRIFPTTLANVSLEAVMTDGKVVLGETRIVRSGKKIRRLQRDAARRNMMKAIPTATAVIVNPTHYAVAIKYSMDGGAAPKVVAKGKNYVAARIRKRAIEAGVPIVENAPLARALYTSVDVGQEIPTHLYRAVAEILAYIYKLMNGKLPG